MEGQRSASLPSIASSTDSQRASKPPASLSPHVLDKLAAKGLTVDAHGTVGWIANNAAHPRHWPMKRKAYDTAVVCFLEFFMTLVSNTGSSLARQAAKELDIERTTSLVCFTTTYMLSQALGGLIFPPLAESYGGRKIYVTSTFAFAVFCLAIAVWPHVPVIIVGRFGSGVISAIPAVVAASTIENMFDLRARIWVVHIWIASAVLGLALGPPLATIVATSSHGWQWVFYIAAGVGFLSAILCLGMRESRPSRLLHQQVRAVAGKSGLDSLHFDNAQPIPDVRTFVRTTLLLPIRLFFTEAVVFFCSIMAAMVVGVTYLFSEAFSVIYTDIYGFSQRQSSMVSLAIAIGVVFTFLPRIFDVHLTNQRRRDNQTIQPEDKLFGFYVAAPILAVGLWWFAATVPPLVIGVSPWVSISSVVLFGFAVVEFNNVLSGYLCDAYASIAGSASAPMAFLRAVLSGLLPLWGKQMFERLGANYALFLLAGVATTFCAVAALLGIYGRTIRERSPFAEKTWCTGQGDTPLAASTPSSASLEKSIADDA